LLSRNSHTSLHHTLYIIYPSAVLLSIRRNYSETLKQINVNLVRCLLRTTLTANITKDDITLQHIAKMSLCCEVISSFVIFAVLVLCWAGFYMILHLPTKFHTNGVTFRGVMTPYRFFKMAAIKSEIYFLLRFQ